MPRKKPFGLVRSRLLTGASLATFANSRSCRTLYNVTAIFHRFSCGKALQRTDGRVRFVFPTA
jgi:hypothetical protein